MKKALFILANVPIPGVNQNSVFGPTSQVAECPFCKQTVTTNVGRTMGMKGVWFCVLCCFLGYESGI